MDIHTFLTLVSPYWMMVVTVSPWVIGNFMPPFINLINKDLDKSAKFWVTVVVCFILALLAKGVEVINEQNWTSVGNMLGLFTVIFTESQIVYWRWFATSELKEKQEAGTLNQAQ